MAYSASSSALLNSGTKLTLATSANPSATVGSWYLFLKGGAVAENELRGGERQGLQLSGRGGLIWG